MLKIYKMPNGKTYQFEEAEAPAEAVELKKAEPEKKTVTPKNKARKAAKK